MADRINGVPPVTINGISRPGKGKVVVKPKDMKGTLLRLWKLTKGQRKGLEWILLLSALSSASAIFSPYLTGKVVTAIVNGDPIYFVLGILCALYIGNALIAFLQQFFMASIGQRVIYHIRKVLFDHVKILPLAYTDHKQHGELMSRLTNDVDNISTTISNSLTLLLSHVFTIIGIFIMMVVLSPILTLVSMVGIALILTLTRAVTKRTRKLFKDQQVALGSLNGQVEESISGLSVVKAFGMEERMEEDFNQKNGVYCEASIKALICSGYLMPLMNVINNLCYLSLAVLSGILYIEGKLSDIGLITSFLLYVRQFTRPFVEVANIYNEFQTAVAGAERVFEIMDEAPETPDRPGALSLPNPKGDIVFDHVTFGYTPQKTVLKDISVKIPAGTQVAIVGATGSGKTTFINLLTRFYDVKEGRILLDGHDLRDYRMESLRRAFGVVLQDTALFAESVTDNIRYGHKEESFEKVKEAAVIAGADGFIERLPNGYDTVLEQGGNELSQGERQLLTIARAVLAGAPIIILDEATSSVDTVTEQKIRRAMLKMCGGRTSFLIAHRLSTIREADMILLIEDGRIVEQGTHEELLKLGGRYAFMFKTQSGEDVETEGEKK